MQPAQQLIKDLRKGNVFNIEVLTDFSMVEGHIYSLTGSKTLVAAAEEIVATILSIILHHVEELGYNIGEAYRLTLACCKVESFEASL